MTLLKEHFTAQEVKDAITYMNSYPNKEFLDLDRNVKFLVLLGNSAFFRSKFLENSFEHRDLIRQKHFKNLEIKSWDESYVKLITKIASILISYYENHKGEKYTAYYLNGIVSHFEMLLAESIRGVIVYETINKSMDSWLDEFLKIDEEFGMKDGSSFVLSMSEVLKEHYGVLRNMIMLYYIKADYDSEFNRLNYKFK